MTLNELQTQYKLSVNDVINMSDVEIDIKYKPRKAKELKLARELAKAMLLPKENKPCIDNPQQAYNLFFPIMQCLTVETFMIALVNTRRKLIKTIKLATGTIDTLLVHPREVFREAIIANAAAIVLAHNHPTGDPTPSEADVKVTRDLIRAGQLLKIDVLDHIVIGKIL